MPSGPACSNHAICSYTPQSPFRILLLLILDDSRSNIPTHNLDVHLDVPDLLGQGPAGASDRDGTGLGGHGDALGDDEGLDGRDVLHLFRSAIWRLFRYSFGRSVVYARLSIGG